MKFCKDCKWLGRNDMGCLAPRIPINKITGEKEWCYATNVRDSEKRCGYGAKWFEEKEKPIPLCMECKWHIVKTYVNEFHLCSFHPIVNGAPTETDNPQCKFNRTSENSCGKYGKWFEKKAIPIGGIIEYRAVKLPKSQPRLCKLICGFEKKEQQKATREELLKLFPDIDKLTKNDTIIFKTTKQQSWLCKLICGRKK